MADEFAKGFGVLTTAGLAWVIISSWYTTTGFESTRQLIAAPPQNPDLFGQIALVTREALFWFAIIGAVTFWVVIPAFRHATGRTVEENR